jgi:large subunit ribosomal protein L21
MFAVIRTGGKQYKVAAGDKIKVEMLGTDAGKSVDVEVLSFFDGKELKIGKTGIKVSAKVLSHGKSDKVVVFKKKRRQNYRRTRGHRQPYTMLEIADFGKAA